MSYELSNEAGTEVAGGILPKRMEDAVARRRIGETLDIDKIASRIKSRFLREDRFDKRDISRDVVKSLARLILELEPKLPEYDTILSDDAKGRLLGLLLHKVINNQQNRVEGNPAQIYFLAGSRTAEPVAGLRAANIDTFLKKKKGAIGKVLLVTDVIDTGEVMDRLAGALEQNNIDYDIATLGITIRSDPASKSFNETWSQKSWLKHVYHGENDSGADLAFFAAGGAYALGVNSGGTGPHPRRGRGRMESMKEAREDISMLAQELSKLLEPAE